MVCRGHSTSHARAVDLLRETYCETLATMCRLFGFDEQTDEWLTSGLPALIPPGAFLPLGLRTALEHSNPGTKWSGVAGKVAGRFSYGLYTPASFSSSSEPSASLANTFTSATPTASAAISRNLYFWILPDAVIG